MNIFIENRLVVIGGDGKTERLSSTELITEEEKNLSCNINPLSDNLFSWAKSFCYTCNSVQLVHLIFLNFWVVLSSLFNMMALIQLIS